MSDHNSVYFKATKDNIIVMMDNSSDFEDIKKALEIKVKEARKFFGDSSTAISFKGRDLDRDQQSQLVDVIMKETNLQVSAITATGESAGRKRRPAKDKLVKLEQLISPDEEIENPYADTIFHKGSLRSGMSIEHSGSVVVLGDVNPGGEIIAGGNIIVLGVLKGLAHAGAFGNSEAYVAAISLQATQLRISNIITSLAEELSKKKKPEHSQTPSYAYIQNGQIYIAPLV